MVRNQWAGRLPLGRGGTVWGLSASFDLAGDPAILVPLLRKPGDFDRSVSVDTLRSLQFTGLVTNPEANAPSPSPWHLPCKAFMKRIWLLFSQAVTLLLAVAFVLACLLYTSDAADE